MTVLAWLVPIALAMGALALLAFIWSMRTGQYDDLDGAAERVLLAQKEDRPLTGPSDQPPARMIMNGAETKKANSFDYYEKSSQRHRER